MNDDEMKRYRDFMALSLQAAPKPDDEVSAAMGNLMQNAYPGPLEGLQNVRLSYDGETAQVSVEPIDIYKPVYWYHRLWWRVKKWLP